MATKIPLESETIETTPKREQSLFDNLLKIVADLKRLRDYIVGIIDGTVPIPIPSLKKVLSSGNDGNASQIKNIADPTADQDAATKKYVDNSTPTISDASATTKGITKLSVAPVLATNPIAVGDNDPRNSDARPTTSGLSTVLGNSNDGGGNDIKNVSRLQTSLNTNSIDIENRRTLDGANNTRVDWVSNLLKNGSGTEWQVDGAPTLDNGIVNKKYLDDNYKPSKDLFTYLFAT